MAVRFKKQTVTLLLYFEVLIGHNLARYVQSAQSGTIFVVKSHFYNGTEFRQCDFVLQQFDIKILIVIDIVIRICVAGFSHVNISRFI